MVILLAASPYDFTIIVTILICVMTKLAHVMDQRWRVLNFVLDEVIRILVWSVKRLSIRFSDELRLAHIYLNVVIAIVNMKGLATS